MDGCSWTPGDAQFLMNHRTASALPMMHHLSSENASFGKPTARSAAKQQGKKPLTESSGNRTTCRKRKSDAMEDADPIDLPEIDEDDPRLHHVTDSCQVVRRKILNFVESGAMKVGEFQREIGVSSKAYLRFMKEHGTWKGEGCDTYWKAFVFFKKRELQGLSKPKKSVAHPSKKAKQEEEGKWLDVEGITLYGEESDSVPVHETCDEICKKIWAVLKNPGITQAAFCREIAKSYHDGRNVQASTLARFLTYRGPYYGCTSSIFYGSYVFFEKRRIKEGKPKSEFRLRMEQEWSHQTRTGNVEFETNREPRYLTLHSSETASYDQYGKINIHKRN